MRFTRHLDRHTDTYKGFTIVEVLIAIVIIAILVTISIVSYNGIVYRSQRASAISELTVLATAIRQAQTFRAKSLHEIGAESPAVWAGTVNGQYGGASGGIDHPCPANMTNIKMTDTANQCVATYLRMLDRLTAITRDSYSQLRDGDPWGRPYVIDDEEDGSAYEECNSNDRVVSANSDGWRSDFNRSTNNWYKQKSFPSDFPGIIVIVSRVTERPDGC